MDIHKGILVKEIDDQDNFIYPKSSSDVITHGENEETTVEAELNRLSGQVDINIENIENINNEIRDARLPAAGGDPKTSLNDRLNTDYSNLREQISTLGGQLSGDLNRITALINTENRNTRLIVGNYKEISRARKTSSNGTIKDTLNDRINSDYLDLDYKIKDNNDKSRILKKFLTKQIKEIKNARQAFSDHEYKISIGNRITDDIFSLYSQITNIGTEVSNARKNSINNMQYGTLKDRLDIEYSALGGINTEVSDARTSIRYKNENDPNLGFVIGVNLKDRLDGDFDYVCGKINGVNGNIRELEDSIDAAINASNSTYNPATTLKGRLEHDYSYLLNQITTSNNQISDINELLPRLYLTAGQTYTIDHVFCMGVYAGERKEIGCFIPTPPLIGVHQIDIDLNNLKTQAEMLVRMSDTRGWLDTGYKNNIFINNKDEGEAYASTGGTVYMYYALEVQQLSASNISFTPKKYGIEFKISSSGEMDPAVTNQPVEVTFKNLKLILS